MIFFFFLFRLKVKCLVSDSIDGGNDSSVCLVHSLLWTIIHKYVGTALIKPQWIIKPLSIPGHIFILFIFETLLNNVELNINEYLANVAMRKMYWPGGTGRFTCPNPPTQPTNAHQAISFSLLFHIFFGFILFYRALFQCEHGCVRAVGVSQCLCPNIIAVVRVILVTWSGMNGKVY